MSRILVTGASGFIGAAVSTALAARGDEVWAFDIASSRAIEEAADDCPLLHFVPGEITEWHHVAQTIKDARPDAVIHCAAIVGVVASAAAPLAAIRVNIEGAVNLIEAMRLLEVKRLVNISTEEIYGPFLADEIDEDHPCRPVMPYGISKFAVEQFARDYQRRYGLECIHLRTCWVYGPGLPRERPPKTLVDAAVEGRALHIPSGADFRVDHVYIDDLVDGILAALDKPGHRFDAYHIATGAAPSMGEIVDIVNDAVPGAQLSIAAGPMQFSDGIDVVQKGALNISRARAELGYAPKFDIQKGIAAYIAATRGF